MSWSNLVVIYRKTRPKSQRDKLMCRLTIDQINKMEKQEKELHRALNTAELRQFGYVNSKGQYLPSNRKEIS